ncbi:hypothetical protein GCM10027093_27060 [Paraburkholderia jirisanensis]
MNNPSLVCTLRLEHTDLVMQNHRVHGVSVMPGVVFLDLAVRILAARGHDFTGYALERVLFSEPVVTATGSDRELRVRIRLPAASAGALLVDSRVWGSTGPFVENMRAVLVADHSAARPPLDAAALKARMTGALQMSEMYRRARLENIDHRAPMRCVGQLWKGDGALLAELRLEVPAEPGFHMHPAALDAATIAAYGQTEAAFNAPYIPVSIDRVRIVAPLSEQFYLHAPRTETLAATGDVISNDYDLYDHTGRHCASFTRLTCKRIRAPELITRLLQAPVADAPVAAHAAPADVSAVNSTVAAAAAAAAPSGAAAHHGSYARLLKEWIGQTLSIAPDAVAEQVGFYEMGLGSRELLALAARLEATIGREIYPTLLFEHRDIATLDAHLLTSFGAFDAVVPATVDAPAQPVSGAPAVSGAQTALAASVWVDDTRRRVRDAVPRLAVYGLDAAGFDSLRTAALARGSRAVVAVHDPRALAEDGELPDALVWFGKRGATPDAQLAELAQWSAACHRSARKLDLLVVERGAAASPLLHGHAAFLRSVRIESPRIAARALLAPQSHWQQAVLAELERADEALPATAGLIAGGAGESAPAVQTLVPHAYLDDSASTPALSRGAVCVLAGGAGGIGVQLARWLVEQVAARVIVLGRSQPAAERIDEWASVAAPASIVYERCELTDRAALDAVLDGVRQRFGRIDAVFHVAGVQRDELHFNLSASASAAVLAPKIDGFTALDEATAQDPLQLFAVFSSLAAWRPNPGQGAYAFANAMLEELAGRRRRDPSRSGTTLAFAWPLWEEGGMRLASADLASAIVRTGLQPLPSAVALACLSAATRLQTPGATLAVLHGDAGRYGGWLADPAAARAAAPGTAQAEAAPHRVTEPSGVSGAQDNPRTAAPGDIAIVGLAGRYPGADDIDAFWAVLRDGCDAIRDVPPERWDHAAIFDPQRGLEGRTYGRWGGFLSDIEGFDAALFHMSRREAERADPQERLFLETCWTLLEAAGHPAAALADRNVGVFAGVMWNHYQLCGDAAEVAPSAMHASVANRVSYALDLRGPSLAVDTACSSSLTAISLALDALRGGACSMAIAGGVNLAVHPVKYLQLAQGQFLSDDGRCRSFGAGGNGYVPGEGVGAVLLRPLADALRDGDHVWGVIRGCALNHAGRTSGFTVPSPAAQADVMALALRNAGVDGASISYVEAHGTGTALGDPIEIEGIGRVLGRAGDAPLPVGSVKSNIGHLESAAGIAALSKVLLMARARQLVPSLHSHELNGALRLAPLGLHIQQTLAPWQPSAAGVPRRAAISAFGAGGANAHLIVDEYVANASADTAPASVMADWLLLSARDEAGLRDYAGRLAQALCSPAGGSGPDALTLAAELVNVHRADLAPDESARSLGLEASDLQMLAERLGCDALDPDQPLASMTVRGGAAPRVADVASTLQTGRTHLQCRLALRVTGLGAAATQLQAFADGVAVTGVRLGHAAADTGSQPLVPQLAEAGVEAWLQGRDVDFAPLWAGAAVRRVALPVPRLQHQHAFWIGRWQRETLAHPQPQALSAAPARGALDIKGTRDMSDNSSREAVSLKVLANGVALVRMQEEEHNNMFTQALLDGLAAAFATVEADLSIRAVVLTGTDKVFSMGGTPAALERLARKEGSFTDVPFLYEGLGRCRVPVIAAIRGHAAGGGLTFGLHADHVLLDRDGTYSANFVKFGFTPGLGATYALERRFGAALAAEMCMTASSYAGRELEALGVALRFADGPQLLLTALRIAEAIAGQAAPVVNALKRELAGRVSEDLARVVVREAAMHDQVLHADLVPAIRARTERTQPATALPGLAPVAPQPAAAAAVQPPVAAPPQPAAAPRAPQSVQPAAVADAKPRIRDTIETTLCRNLFVHRSELDPRRTFAEMGLDSLGAVEIVRDLNHVFSLNLDSVLVYDHPTLERLVAHVADQLSANDDRVAAALEPVAGSEAGSNVDSVPGPATREPAMPAASRPEDGLDIEADAATPEPAPAAPVLRAGEPRATSQPAALASAVSRSRIEVPQHAPSAPPLRLKLAPVAQRTSAAPAAQRSEPQAFAAQRSEPEPSEPRPAATPAVTAPPAAAQSSADSRRPERAAADDELAIIGLSARYPGAANAGELWQNLLAGRFGVTEISPQRWDVTQFYDPDPTVPGKTSSKVAGLVADIDRFDAGFFGISPREAELTDPQQRVFLEQAWRALEDAGYAVGPERRINCGVFVGTAAGDYMQLLQAAGVSDSGQVFLGNSTSILAGRIAYFLNLEGPTVALDTACSSSLVALHLACQAIRSGDCEMAVAGGIALMVTPQMHIWNSKSGMLSTLGRCASFDASADGFVLGEGAGLVVVKRLSAALADRDRIYAVIKASGVNGDGKTNGITAPSADAQLALQRRVHAQAGVSADDIAYIETHGAGTQLGDPIELKALAALMQDRSSAVPPCGVGSIKSNLGHTTLASGIAGLLKVTLGLQHGEIPPSLHFDTLNPNIELNPALLQVVTARRPWPAGPGGQRIGAVNSFGMSGTNAHFVLQEPPAAAAQAGREGIVDEACLLLVSARTAAALRTLLEGLMADLEAGAALADVSYTLGVGRAWFRKRSAIVAGDAVQAIALIRRALAEGTPEGVHSTHREAPAAAGSFARALSGAELSELGVRFCSGQPGFELGEFFARRRGRRIAMCIYPLADQRFWVPEGPHATAPSPVGAEPLQALLQNTVRETIDPGTDWVRDHRVQGNHWVPGAAILYYSARAQKFRPVELSDVEWLSPALVAGPVALEIHGSVDADGQYKIEMRVAGQPSFTRARCIPQGGGRPLPRMSFDTLVASCSTDVGHAELYRRFEQAGIAYGPSYRLLTRIVHSAQTAIGWLRTDTARGMIQTFDAILQTVGVLEQGAGLKLPRRIDKARLNLALDHAVSVVAHRIEDGHYDVIACDRDGNAVLEVSGFRLITSPDDGTRMYEPRWNEIQPGAPLAASSRAYVPLRPAGEAALPPLPAGGELVIDARGVTEAQPEQALQAARELLAQLCRTHPDGCRVTWLSAGATPADPAAPQRPLQAALGAMARAAAAERPALQLQVIDLAYDSAASPEDLPARPAGLPGLAARRAGRWYARAWRPIPRSSPYRLLGDGETCLIVGGTGGIGFELSKELARTHRAALGWIGRRPVDETIHAQIRTIEQLGGRAMYVTASLGDEAQLADAVRSVRRRFGPISAAFHSALVLDDANLDAMSAAQLERVLEPKVAGCLNLYRCLEAEPLDKLVLFSSVSSLLDSPGQGNYAAASAYLDACGSEWRRRYGAPVFVVNWGYWGSFGVVAGERYRREMAARGVGSIEPAEAFECLRMQIGTGLSQTMVLNADPQRFAAYGLTLEGAAPAAAANPVQPIQRAIMQIDHSAPRHAGQTPGEASAVALPEVTKYLARVFATVLKCDPAVLDAQETFESFGVDSLLGMDILRALKRELGELPSTLLYQQLTIAELAAWLVQHRRAALAGMFAPAPGVVPQALPQGSPQSAGPAAAARAATAITTTTNTEPPRQDAANAVTPAANVADAIEYVRSVFGKVLKLEPAALDVDETFESYGVDSLLGTDILRMLKTDFADLPSTLLYERLTIAEVAAYLRAARGGELARLLAAHSGLPLPGTAKEGDEPVAADRRLADTRRSLAAASTARPASVATAPVPPAPASAPASAPARRSTGYANGDLAVIASVGRYPGAADLDAFWENLCEGRRSIGEVPAARWDADAYFDPAPQKNRSYGKWAGFIDGVDQFDAKFFGILPSDASAIDPQERLFLESCWELLEQAGHNGPDGREARTGVFVGIMYGSYGQMAAAAGWPQGQFNLGHSPYWSVANRVSYTFNFSGPSMAIDTACSSSLTAFHLACESIRRGECRQAIAGGVNVILHPAHHIALSSMRMLGTGLACRTFDKTADGIVPGEGVGAVLLRPLEDALADGDEILAVVRGSTINAGGKTGGYTVPNVNAQADVIAGALERAGVAPHQVGAVEVHGTGTQLGDPIEIAALNKVFGGARSEPLLVSSVKSNIGHLEGAAGIAGISKAILQLQHGKLAPCAGLDELNDKIDFGASVMPARTLQAWPRAADQGPALCAVSSFGAGGANAHVVLQQWQETRATMPDSGTPQAFLLAATSHTQLAAYAERVADWLLHHPAASLHRLCFTSQSGRRHLPVRAVAMAASLDELQAALRAIAAREPAALVSPAADHSTLALGDVADELIELLSARRQLRKLGELWVNGLAVDWRRTWDNMPGRCSFPAVPFERKRIWMAQPSAADAAAAVPAPAQRLAQLAAAHRIGARNLVPGAALLELMLDHQGHGLPRALTSVRWLRPVEVTQDAAVDLQVNDAAAGFSVQPRDGGASVAQALPGNAPHGAVPVRALDEVWAACAPAVDGAELYQRLHAGGFEYAAPLRVVSRFAAGDALAIGELDGARLVPSTAFAAYVDGALQLVSLLAHQAGVPAGIAALTQFGAPEQARAALVERRADGTFDVTLCDAHGQVLILLQGLRIAALPAAAMPSVAALPDYLCAVETVESRGVPLLGSGTVLLMGKHLEGSAALAAVLQRRGFAVERDTDAPLTDLAAVLVLLDPAGADATLSLAQQLAGLRDLLERVKAVRGQRSVRFLAVGQSGELAAAALAAATHTLAMELPWLACSHLLLALDQPGWADEAVDELCAAAAQGTVRIDAGTRLVRSLQPLKLDAAPTPVVRPGAVYLVTGGAGALGRHFAAHLASRGPATVVLLGRRAADAQLDAWMASLGGRGSRVAYMQADVGDADALTEAVAAIVAQHGPLRGVLHAAGVRHDALLLKKTDREISQVLRPKVRGVLALDAATAGEPLDFFVLCSSLAAETGNLGQIDYATGNRFLIEFGAARERERAAGRRHGATVTVAWPLWEDGGMKVDAATEALFRQRFGMRALSTEAGLAALDVALAGRYAAFALVQREAATPATLTAAITAATSATSATPTAAVVHASPVPEPVVEAVAAPAAAQLRAHIVADLQRIGAGYLMVDAAEVDVDSELLELGFDSISLTDMINQINAHYGLDLLPTVLFECPTLNDVADYLGREQGPRIAARFIKPQTAGLAATHADTARALVTPSVAVPATAAPAAAPSTVVAAPLAPSALAPSAAAAPTVAAVPAVPPAPATAAQAARAATPHAVDTAIAVIGMAGRLASAASLGQFWDALESGTSLIGAPPSDRDALLRDPVTAAVRGGFLQDVARFDAARFGISPREAALMDPQQRIFLETVLQAIEDAGYGQQALAGRDVGLFAGVSTSDYESLLTEHGVKVEPHVASGVAHSIIANRVSHLFGWHGPSEAVDTACSSALVALNRAVKALRNGECEMAVAGGVNVMLTPGLFHAFIDSGMLSADFACKTFDRHANGYVRGEGVGAVVLKPLARALAERDNVLAIVRGVAVNHGGKSSSLTAPNPASQAEVIRRAIADAGVDPRHISFIETHGTGTPLGDPVEIEGLKRGLELACDDAGVSVPAKPWIALGAVKTVIGHLEAAAGIAGLLRTILSLQHMRLSANRNFTEQNPYIRLDASPFELLNDARDWQPRDGEPLIAGVSSFGFGGSNSHVIVEAAAARDLPTAPSGVLAFPLSAPDAARLASYADGLARELVRRERALDDVAFTLQHGRDALACRSVLVAASCAELIEQLRSVADGAQRDPARLDRLAGPLRAAALQWLSGIGAGWPDSAGRRCALPGVPLAGERHWFRTPAARGADAVGTVGTTPAARTAPAATAATTPAATATPVPQLVATPAALARAAAPAEPARALAAAPRTPVRLRPLETVAAFTADSPPAAPVVPVVRPPAAEAPAPLAMPLDVTPIPASGSADAIREDLAEILLMPVEQISFDARFDDLGLDSIFRMDLVRRINQRFGTQLMGEDLYNVDSVAALAAVVDTTRGAVAQAPALVAIPVAVPASASLPASASDAAFVCAHVAALTGRPLSDHDDFSDAGLTSFDMLRVIAGLEAAFGPMPKSSLFDYPTPHALAQWLIQQYGSDAAARLAAARGVTHEHAALTTEYLANGAAVIVKRELHAHPELAATVAELEAAWAKEGGLPGRDIAPLIFLGSGASGYLNFSERDGLLLAWSSVVDEPRYAALAGEWVAWATSRGLRPNLLSMMPLHQVAGMPFCSTSFGTVQRLNDIQSFSLAGKDMNRLRKKINRFERSGNVSVDEYRLGDDVGIDQQIVRLIDEWAARKEMVNPYVGTVRREIGAGILAERHRVFVTTVNDAVVAAIIVTKIPSENGYLLDLEFFGDAMEDGGLDYTIIAIIERLAQEGVQMFSFGATLGVLVAPSPNPSPQVERTIGELRESGIFSGDGNFQFKNKYRPQNLPVYLCQPEAASPADISSVLLLIVNPTIPAAYDSAPPPMSETGAPAACAGPQPVAVPDSATALAADGLLADAVRRAGAPVDGDSPRRAQLRDAGWNPLRLPQAADAFELVTDSWAERDDVMVVERVRELTDTANAICLDLADQHTLPFSYVQAAPSGRTAELALLRAAAGAKKGIIQNHLFQSWTFNQLELGYVPHLLRTMPHGADIDLVHLDQLIAQQRATVALCCIELAPNATGGLAMSLDNLRAVRERLQAAGIPLVFDATRGFENASMIGAANGTPFWDTVAELFGLADALTLSMSKDFGVNAGGLVASNHPALTRALQQRVQDRGHDVPMAGRRLLASALADKAWIEQAVVARLRHTAQLAAMLGEAGIPVRASGAHAVLVDAAAWCRGHAEPVASALAALYELAGVRAAPHLHAGLAEASQCIRLAVPVGLGDAALDELRTALLAAREQGATPAELLRVPGDSASAGSSYVLRDSVPDEVVEALQSGIKAPPQGRNAELVRRWQPAVKRHLVPFEGAQIEVFESGTGEPVVLLHPFNIGAGFFAPQLKELAARRRVVVVHAPGVDGTTYAADLSFAGLSRLVLAAARGVGVDSRFVVAGASFGGLTALAVAHAHPEWVSGLVLLGSSYKVGNRRGEVNRLDVVAREDFDALERAGVTLDVPRAQYESLLAECESMDPRIGLRYLDVFATKPSLLEAARELKVPALLIHGEHDTVIATAIAREIDAVLPQSRYEQLDDAGHFPSLTSHRRVNALIDAFVDAQLAAAPRDGDPLERRSYEAG